MFPISEFDQNGFACPIPVINSSQAASLAEQIMKFQHEDPDKAARAFGTNTHLLFPSLCEVIQREQILDAVEQVLGKNLLLWSASFFIKGPKTSSFVSWHQDSTYWGLEPPEIVTAWLALTPSNLENGCMEVAPRATSEAKCLITILLGMIICSAVGKRLLWIFLVKKQGHKIGSWPNEPSSCPYLSCFKTQPHKYSENWFCYAFNPDSCQAKQGSYLCPAGSWSR